MSDEEVAITGIVLIAAVAGYYEIIKYYVVKFIRGKASKKI